MDKNTHKIYSYGFNEDQGEYFPSEARGSLDDSMPKHVLSFVASQPKSVFITLNDLSCPPHELTIALPQE